MTDEDRKLFEDALWALQVSLELISPSPVVTTLVHMSEGERLRRAAERADRKDADIAAISNLCHRIRSHLSQ